MKLKGKNGLIIEVPKHVATGLIRTGAATPLDGETVTAEKVVTETTTVEVKVEVDTDGFDPSAHKVDEILAHLDGADEAEIDRVLNLEEVGKKRASVLNWEPQDAE